MFTPQIQAVMDRVDQLRDQVDDHWQIPRDEALVLAQIVRIGRFKSLCEVGVSYGFSTLHLAAAAKPHGGHVHAIDISEKKIKAATANLTEAGLIDAVTLHLGDAREVLKTLTPTEPIDFAFIDADKPQSRDYLNALWDKLACRAVIATDNISTHPERLTDYLADLCARPGVTSCPVAVGNGFELTLVEH